ncbi:MAG: phosphatase PAP2 family protein [Clostridia bacterium]|nr:phosphatase PAP2 family protein [Clostridia bacterium]
MTAVDFFILDSIKSFFSCYFLNSFMPFVSFLGNSGGIWIVSGIILLIFPKYRKNGWFVLLSLLAGFIICNLTLKPLVARPRPCWIRPDAALLISVPHDFSFPSGHTVSSFAAAESLRYANRKLGIWAYILAILIAFSRLYLYVHFPSDVFIGALIGFMCGHFVPKLTNK